VVSTRRLLSLTAIGCFGISVLHLVLCFAGVEVNRFFGAPKEILQMVVDHEPGFYLMVLGIVVLFAGFGAYALSGAGTIRRLPFRKSVLTFLGVILVLRGITVFVEVPAYVREPGSVPWQFPCMSAVALVFGIMSLLGVGGMMREQRTRAIL
jgi:hypothetical protein